MSAKRKVKRSPDARAKAPEHPFVRHVRRCEKCIVVGCTSEKLCLKGIKLWNRWVKSGKGAVA